MSTLEHSRELFGQYDVFKKNGNSGCEVIDEANRVPDGNELDVHVGRERPTTEDRYAEVYVNDPRRQDGHILRAGTRPRSARADSERYGGMADTGAHPSVEIRVDARALRVIDKDESEKDRAEVQKTMLGPEVLDSEHYQEIVFKSTGAETAGQGRWTVHGTLTLRGQTQPVTVHVTLKDGRYAGETTVKQTDFGIPPPGKAGVRAKDEVRIAFEVRLEG